MIDITNESANAPTERTIPEDALIILAVRNAVLFPGIVLPLVIGRPESVAAAREAVQHQRPLGFLLQTDGGIDTPGPEELHHVGTTGEVVRYATTADDTHHLVCRGGQRFRVLEFLPGYPFLVARVAMESDSDVVTPEIEARVHQLKAQVQEALEFLPGSSAELLVAINNLESPPAVADFISGVMDFSAADKQDLLETLNVTDRLDKVLALLSRRVEVLKLSKEIGEQTKESMEAQQREHILREQLRQIQKELGEEDGKAAEITELQTAIDKAKMPQDIAEHASKELKRLERTPEASAEYGMIRTFLDWLLELPWSKQTSADIDIGDARRILDEDHYGLDKIKKRILEYLAVRKLNPHGKGPILCFVGPPGVGKTSLGQSIARATGREFVRISLGGVHDEAEIRGHRRTYIGALPGNIIQALRKAGANDPVFMLDEMDKLSASFQGDPSSALLEVLDPEQNSTFRDNYLGVPFDLSNVMFIGTANVIDSIPGPLRDRMEVIELTGYTEEEKVAIARRYLIKRQLESTGLTSEQCSISDDAIRLIVREYTREAGCRNLEREIGALCRHVAMRVAEGETGLMRIEGAGLRAILGPRRFESEVALRTSVPGVATGLAWTPTGGEILFVEATRVPGSGKLILTGQLGDVMKESAQAALTVVKGQSERFALDDQAFEAFDVHIHVPAGAVPKDGPSAGVAMFVSLVSLLTDRNVRSDIAMTGEISLRGIVLPVGGIKEKVLAAVRAGITTVLLPERNRKDLEDIPEVARKQVRFIWLDSVDDAIAAAIETNDTPKKLAR